MTTGRYWIAPDGDGEPTIWQDMGNPFGPEPVARRCDVTEAAWELLCQDIPKKTAL